MAHFLHKPAPGVTVVRNDLSNHHASPPPIATETRGLRSAQKLTLLERPASPPSHLPAKLPGIPRFLPATRPEQREFYAAMVVELKAKYKIAIRKWRTHISGVAYEVKYRDGHIKRLIAAPRPRSPVSAAIFLHEVGHHAIGFKRYQPRCLEEYYVWQWAFREMTARSIPIDARVMRHYKRSLFHYVRLAKRLGIKDLPHELHAFHHWPG